VWELPDVQRQARGQALINVINLEPDERVTTCLPISDFEAGGYLILATRRGEIKRSALADYASVRQNGIKTMDVEEGDELAWVARTGGTDELILVTARGQAVTFAESVLRVSGRTSGGVRGIRLDPGDDLVALQVVRPEGSLLMITGNGIGKQTPFGEFPRHGRGGSGVRASVLDERTGPLVAAQAVDAETKEIVAITRHAVVIRIPVESVSTLHRAARGVQLMRVASGEAVAALTRITAEEEEELLQESGQENGRASNGVLALDGAAPLGRSALGDGALDGVTGAGDAEVEDGGQEDGAEDGAEEGDLEVQDGEEDDGEDDEESEGDGDGGAS
jgi:DNA gyrase subunit A